VSERFCTVPLWQTPIFDGWGAFLGIAYGLSLLPIPCSHVEVTPAHAPLFSSCSVNAVHSNQMAECRLGKMRMTRLRRQLFVSLCGAHLLSLSHPLSQT
jgi:hypothetical protein